MSNGGWNNPWKLIAVGMALVAVTAFATSLVVANRSGKSAESQKAADVTSPAWTSPRPTTAASSPSPTPAVPTQSIIATCNQRAASQVPSRDKTVDTVKDGAIGAVAGAVVGAAGGAIAGGGSGAGKGAAIGGAGGAGGGARRRAHREPQHDAQCREGYGACMRSHGYIG